MSNNMIKKYFDNTPINYIKKDLYSLLYYKLFKKTKLPEYSQPETRK